MVPLPSVYKFLSLKICFLLFVPRGKAVRGVMIITLTVKELFSVYVLEYRIVRQLGFIPGRL